MFSFQVLIIRHTIKYYIYCLNIIILSTNLNNCYILLARIVLLVHLYYSTLVYFKF